MSSALLMEYHACGAMGCKAGFRLRRAPAARRAAATLPLFCRLPVHLQTSQPGDAALGAHWPSNADDVSDARTMRCSSPHGRPGRGKRGDGAVLRTGAYPGVKAVMTMDRSRKSTAPVVSKTDGLS